MARDACMELAATTWVPMGARVPVVSPNDHTNPSKRRQKGLEKSQDFEIFQVPLKGGGGRG